MYNGNTVFAHLLELIPRFTFHELVVKYKSDHYTKSFHTWDHFVCLMFAQIRGIESLRDTTLALSQHQNKLYHLGISSPKLTKSTLSHANRRIPHKLYENLFYKLLDRYSDLLKDRTNFQFKNNLYALDASFIDLIIEIFPWAKFRSTKGAVKIHLLLDVRKVVPSLVNFTDGKVHDLDGLVHFSKEVYAGSIFVFDKGYWDISWFWVLDEDNIFFVTRLKMNVKYEIIESNPIRGKGVLKDQIIRLSSIESKRKYPKILRMVTFHDTSHDRKYQFITNIKHLAPSTIALIYKHRWEVESFFKWIKQNLVIKTFFGTNQNAVFSQIWIALIYQLLLQYIMGQTNYKGSIRNLSSVINERLFESFSLIDLLSFKSPSEQKLPESTQVNLPGDFF